TVEPKRNATVRWRAVLERVDEETEAQARVLVADVQQAEGLSLHARIVDSRAAAAYLAPVQHQVVGLRAHTSGIALQEVEVLVERRGERVVHRRPAVPLRVPFEQREVDDPGKRVGV